MFLAVHHFFLFCVIALGYRVNAVSLYLRVHIKYSECKLELFVRKSKSFLFLFYCKMMQIPIFSAIFSLDIKWHYKLTEFSFSGELGLGYLNRVKHKNQMNT